MDIFNADIHGMMTEYGSNSGAEFQAIANVNRWAMIAGGMMTDQVIANVNQRALIMADMMKIATIAADMIEDNLMMRAYCMALNCKDYEESRTITKINFPPRQLHLPYCQPIQDERFIGMMLCCPTIDEVSVLGPPESVTVSIIIDDNDDCRRCCRTAVSASLICQIRNEEDDINEEEDEEEERLCAWI
jgi:hypothetical protein